MMLLKNTIYSLSMAQLFYIYFRRIVESCFKGNSNLILFEFLVLFYCGMTFFYNCNYHILTHNLYDVLESLLTLKI